MRKAILLYGGLSALIALLGGCGIGSAGTGVSAGRVSPTRNPQVALYSISEPAGASVHIAFGQTTAYGLTTWTQPAPADGGVVNMYVAGMLQNTTYHMQAVTQLADGTQVTDADHTFKTGSIKAALLPQISTTIMPGMAPQPGLELLDLVNPNERQAIVTDLAGNVVWTYPYGNSGADLPEPVEQLADGNFLIALSPQVSTNGLFAKAAINDIREVNLEGLTVHEFSIDDLNYRLAKNGFNLNVYTMHHDVLPLPSGHVIVLANTLKLFNNLPGYPGQLNVLGDVLIDLDQNWEPVWVWNSFDHLDVNRHPMNFPDWTHSNAVLYSPDDGNLLLSMRHQNWILKIDYEDGRGSGNVLWRLGKDGDFKLQGGVDPTDWFYAQHGPHFSGPSTAGNFTLAIFNNGNDRQFPAGVTCGATGAPPCTYSTAMLVQIDEAAKTATIQFNDDPIGYSVFGGNAEQLANGDLEFDMCDISQDPDLAVVYEVMPLSQPQLVWQMNIQNDWAYRAFRIPSMYPGVQW
ncbi:MAG TPA: aryl-sulfate sulfotransferase [Candidatus Acidoferrales bacterium]|nr:aryl-sulfate sulfotransferase [Candidatus Acidoferrales bacterium]